MIIIDDSYNMYHLCTKFDTKAFKKCFCDIFPVIKMHECNPDQMFRFIFKS